MGLFLGFTEVAKHLDIPPAISRIPPHIIPLVEDYIREHVEYQDVPVFLEGVLTALGISFPPGAAIPWDSDCMCARVDVAPGLQLVWTPGDWSVQAVAVGDEGQVSIVIKEQEVKCVVHGAPGPITYARAANLAEFAFPERAHLIRPLLPQEAASMLPPRASGRTVAL